jgi:hypothetical protein
LAFSLIILGDLGALAVQKNLGALGVLAVQTILLSFRVKYA